MSQRGNCLLKDIPREVPKPFTVPPGWTPPSMGEQWRYALLNHPASQYGFPAAALLGLLAWGMASQKDKPEGRPQGKEGQEGHTQQA